MRKGKLAIQNDNKQNETFYKIKILDLSKLGMQGYLSGLVN